MALELVNEPDRRYYLFNAILTDLLAGWGPDAAAATACAAAIGLTAA
jgi:hypothetical protein